MLSSALSNLELKYLRGPSRLIDQQAVRRETGGMSRMKESYGEGVANHSDPKPCMAIRKGRCEASAGACAGQPWSRENVITPRGRRCDSKRKAKPPISIGEKSEALARSKTLSMHRNILRGNREILSSPGHKPGRPGKSKDVILG